MNFLEIESRSLNSSNTTLEPQIHFHDYYELYFLEQGVREMFIDNKMFHVSKNSFCIIPPFCMHKTEGKQYKRVNLYISPNLLDDKELSFLKTLENDLVFSLSQKQTNFIHSLLNEASQMETQNIELRKKYLLPFAKTVLYYLQSSPLTPQKSISSLSETKQADTTILKIVSYINENYAKNITLTDLCDKFFISANTLCKRFRRSMGCSIIGYLTNVRLNKAKMYLLTTNKNLEEISFLCGFSSANYFSLIFKKQYGLSPLNYKKKN